MRRSTTICSRQKPEKGAVECIMFFYHRMYHMLLEDWSMYFCTRMRQAQNVYHAILLLEAATQSKSQRTTASTTIAEITTTQ